MIIAEWIIYVMVFCFCVLSLGVGSIMLVIVVNVLTDRNEWKNKHAE